MYENSSERQRDDLMHLEALWRAMGKSRSAGDKPESVKNILWSTNVKSGSTDEKPGST
jgi:hypothetical protein